MNTFRSTILLTWFLLMTCESFGQTTFCLRFQEVSSTATSVEVDVQIQASSSSALGSGNLVFLYDPAKFTNPTLSSGSLSGPYIVGVTNPAANKASLNLELLIPNMGDALPLAPTWKSVATVAFDVIDPTTSSLNFSYTGTTTETVVFLHDEATQIFATDVSCLESIDLFTSLPIELSEFNVEWESERERDAVLTWTTASETANSHFEIYRSIDGLTWNEVGKVDGQGSTIQTTEYFHIDKFAGNLVSDTYIYYKISQVDFDGTKTTSDVRSLKKTNRPSNIEVFPNPFFDRIKISVPSDFSLHGPVSITISNIDGKSMLPEVSLDNISETITLFTDLFVVESGIYLLTLSNGEKTETFRLLHH